MAKDWTREETQFALLIAEAAFRYAEKGNNLNATLDYITRMGNDAVRQAAERAAIQRAVAKMHRDRGCCDGSGEPPCRWKAMQEEKAAEERKETVKQKLQAERDDFQAWQNAELNL